jgi:hypothetical protein
MAIQFSGVASMILASAPARASEAACEAAPALGDGARSGRSRSKKISIGQRVHSSSTDLAQLFHSRGAMPHNRARMKSAARLAGIALASLAVCVPALLGQIAEPGSTFRVFLRDGTALPAYGESARVGDRLVFTLLIGEADDARLQLMSLPLDAVDVDRTARYAEAMRAAHYAATRGEADYAAITAEVQRALEQLTAIEDPDRRVALAEEAKRRLLSWSRENHSYRARDIAELGALFDDVIGELRAAAGDSRFSLDLRAGPAAPATEPLLPAPTLRDAIDLALVAARAADVAEDRLAILAAAIFAAGAGPDAADLIGRLERERDAEIAATGEYARLIDEAERQSLEAMRAGDVGAAQAARTAALDADRRLGHRRPAPMQALVAALDARLERTRAHRLALDHYALARPALLAYERRMRPVLSGLDGLRPVLTAVEEMRSTAYARLEAASDRLARLRALAGRVTPPDGLTDVHATFLSALHLAEQACARRRLAVATTSMPVAREASSAAAGAQLLAAQARETLVVRLFPPKIQP